MWCPDVLAILLVSNGFVLEYDDKHTLREGRKDITHGIRNEIIEEFAKRKKMCLLEGKKKRTFPVIRRHNGQYHIFSRHYPDLTAIGSINAVVVRRSGRGGSLSGQLGPA